MNVKGAVPFLYRRFMMEATSFLRVDIETACDFIILYTAIYASIR
jgi:hypothetical protein